MLVTSVVVFSYYTIWTLFTVGDAHTRPHNQLSCRRTALPAPILAATRPLPRARVGRAAARAAHAVRLDRYRRLRRPRHGQERAEKECEGQGSVNGRALRRGVCETAGVYSVALWRAGLELVSGSRGDGEWCKVRGAHLVRHRAWHGRGQPAEERPARHRVSITKKQPEGTHLSIEHRHLHRSLIDAESGWRAPQERAEGARKGSEGARRISSPRSRALGPLPQPSTIYTDAPALKPSFFFTISVTLVTRRLPRLVLAHRASFKPIPSRAFTSSTLRFSTPVTFNMSAYNIPATQTAVSTSPLVPVPDVRAPLLTRQETSLLRAWRRPPRPQGPPGASAEGSEARRGPRQHVRCLPHTPLAYPASLTPTTPAASTLVSATPTSTPFTVTGPRLPRSRSSEATREPESSPRSRTTPRPRSRSATP